MALALPQPYRAFPAVVDAVATGAMTEPLT
jgi:hypothetical protein